MAEDIKVEVWLDYTCPFTYRAVAWLSEVKQIYGDKLDLEWHCFPLEQVNSMRGPEWKLWEQSDDYSSRCLWAFRSAKAAGLQGRESFDRFHMSLFRARHEDGRDITDRAVLVELAERAGLDVERFQRDLADRSLMPKIGEDYELGVQQYGIWGSPTLVFNGRSAAYMKLQTLPPNEETVSFFEDLVEMVDRRPYLLEIKRPR